MAAFLIMISFLIMEGLHFYVSDTLAVCPHWVPEEHTAGGMNTIHIYRQKLFLALMDCITYIHAHRTLWAFSGQSVPGAFRCNTEVRD